MGYSDPNLDQKKGKGGQGDTKKPLKQSLFDNFDSVDGTPKSKDQKIDKRTPRFSKPQQIEDKHFEEIEPTNKVKIIHRKVLDDGSSSNILPTTLNDMSSSHESHKNQ